MIQVVEKPSVGRPGRTQHVPAEGTFRVIDINTLTGTDALGIDRPYSSATPDRVSIGTLPHPRLRLRAPLRVEVRRENGEVGVWSPDLEELGIGPHLSAAVEDFQRSVVELYLELVVEAEHDRLGPGMAALWQRLQGMIDIRP